VSPWPFPSLTRHFIGALEVLVALKPKFTTALSMERFLNASTEHSIVSWQTLNTRQNFMTTYSSMETDKLMVQSFLDANVAFRIRNGHVDFKQKFVRTRRFITERAARKPVFGKYRNRYTDEELAKWMIHSTANTHVYFFNGVLLALKEDSPPYALDPNTLKTIGIYDFNRGLPSPTFTAHPKIDHRTGNIYAYGCEAKGDASTDICFFAFDKHANKIGECWVNAPYAGTPSLYTNTGMIHECAISKDWIIFILLPLCVSLDRLNEGGKHFMWENDLPMVLGLLPRNNPISENQRWYPFKTQTFIGHIANAFDVDEHLVCLDTPLENRNVFGAFFPTDTGERPPPGSVVSKFVRFHIDTRKPNGSFVGEAEILVDVNGGMLCRKSTVCPFERYFHPETQALRHK
jgi:hypothetical protein